MTTTNCDLCGVECGGKHGVIRLESHWIRPDISFNPKPLRSFELCPDCFEKFDANKDRIRLVIESEENKTPYPKQQWESCSHIILEP